MMAKKDEEELPISILLEEDLKIEKPPTAMRKKKRLRGTCIKSFPEVYEPTGEILGTGSFGCVQTYRSIKDRKEFAVKIVEKKSARTRKKVLKEIELFHHCRGHPNILQMIEYFEEADVSGVFYLVFEKMEGGTLLSTIGKRGHLTEQEASLVIRDVANAISHLHKKGIAHRDLKPENILCALPNQLTPVKLCDFDLGNDIHINSKRTSPITTPVLQSPVGSVEFMAPEVVDVWQDVANSYNKRCDLWSLGIILYILLCGYVPFYANCGDSCGWENGGACTACQDILFDNIQLGIYDFPEKEWSSISMSAKDLISHLLVRNPAERYSTEEVLQHPWITTDGEELPLATPDVLKKTNSVRELQVFTENANAANRKIQQELSRSASKSSGLTLLTHPACRKSGRLEDDERRRSLSSLHNFDLDDDSDIDCGLVMSSPPRNAITIPPRNNTFQGITRSGKSRSRYGNLEGGYGDGLQIESFSDSTNAETPKFSLASERVLGAGVDGAYHQQDDDEEEGDLDRKRLLSGGGESIGNDSGFCGGPYDVTKLLTSDESVNDWWGKNYYHSRLSF